MQKRVIALLVLSALSIFISMNFISAVFYCNITTSSSCMNDPTGVLILNLSSSSNAHGALITSSSSPAYTYGVCCYNIDNSSVSGPASCSTTANNSYYSAFGVSVPYNKVIGLYAQTNSHAESTGMTYYTNSVCASGLNTCQNVSLTTECSSLGGISVVNLSGYTNAHLGGINFGDTQICCQATGVSNAGIACKLQNATFSQTPVLNGNTVNLIVGGNSDCQSAGSAVNLYVFATDGTQVANPGSINFQSGNPYISFPWSVGGNIAQGQYYFEAVASDSGSTMWSNDSVNSGMNQTLQVYPQKVNCNIVGANPALYNQTSSYYSGTNPTLSEISATCTSDPCGAAQSIFNSESKTNPTQWDYGLQWTPLGSSAGMCEYWEGQSTNPTTPSCDSGYTLCYNSASSTNQPYFCSNGDTCPLDANQNPMNPPTLYDSSGNPTCIVGSGCVNPICTTGSQDSCVSTASCSKTTSGGLCLSNSVVSEQPGTTETAGNTVMAFSSDGVNVGVTLPSGSSYVTGGVTNSLPNGGTVNMTISNTAIAVQLTPAGGSAISLSSGTVVNTPDSVSVNIGSSAVTSYFPIGTVTTVSGGASTTSTTMLTKTINVNSALSVASSITVNAGGTSTTSISGGSGSYSISTQPNSAYATASISGSTLTINGVAAGTTSLVVSDGSQTATISITVQSSGSGITVASSITVNAGGTSTTSISGGSGSYSISTQPNSAYATASISGSTLTINGVAAGTTSLVVSDGSQTATISITVQSSGSSNTIHITVTPTVTPVNQASEGTTLCMDSTTGALVSFAGTSCPSGTTNAPGSCASSNPSSSTCASGLQCTTSGTGGYCYNPSRTSGKCIYHTINTGSSCTDGFLNYTWTTSWTGTGTKPSWCADGSRVISCPANIPLPFFNIYNAIEVIILVALVYTAIIFAKKRQHKGAIHNSSKKKK